MTFRSTAVCLLAALLCYPVSGQSVEIENVRVELDRRDATTNQVPLAFDVSWEGSWREGDRWDAAWVYAKFEREPGVWADLRFSPEGLDVSGETAGVVSPPVLPAGHASGILVHRVADGDGDVQFTVSASWTFGASYFDLPADGVPVRVLGVEMVRVPAGPFEVGESVPDSLRQPNAFRASDGGKFTVQSEDELSVGVGEGLFYDVPEGEGYAGGDAAGPIPASFPKGTDGFYVMKYSLTQGQYANFLSLLTPRARLARDITAYSTYQSKSGSIS
ncbi:MAG: hypothetical protein HKN29_12290, partial [Rhodothermales bacterium]|nr:hypothetical protein [Rhodothermales bacterium]